MAHKDGQPVLVPFTLPGEEISADLVPAGKHAFRAQDVAWLTESLDRAVPPCPYFGVCGGCGLQHMNDTAYTQFKKAQVEKAFQKFKLDTSCLEDVHKVPPGHRRRINFRAVKEGGTVSLGFHQRRSHKVTNIDHCLLLLPSLNALIHPLKEVLNTVLKDQEKAHIFLTTVKEGMDALFVFSEGHVLNATVKSLLTDWAKEHGVVRVLLQAQKKEELLYQHKTPHVAFGGHDALFPVQAFLQPSEAGEQQIWAWVEQHLPKRTKYIADLFCGLGTFTFPLSEHGAVDGFEGHHKAVQYLNLSADQQRTKHPVQGTQRDLFLYPLSPNELNAYDMVFLDPPRAGASNQVKKIAKSTVPFVVMVSCSKDSFARDAAHLLEGGYKMDKTYLLDQFVWSPHLELISFFSRP
ncbi:MAG: class I SAM-dependent RNA methyltransferase [Holosporaceae bacterium]|nr:MAG: class I SAM-dependent RNA methyltransferase [Holosporaceae bacterium]